MRRLLVLVFALVFAGSALAAPAAACVPTRDSLRARPHPCCEVVLTAPVGPCCTVTAPAQRVSNTETRVVAPDQTVTIPRTGDGLFAFNRERASTVSPPVLRGSPVPLYLQQLSLLI
jgi:hypothetical protein